MNYSNNDATLADQVSIGKQVAITGGAVVPDQSWHTQCQVLQTYIQKHGHSTKNLNHNLTLYGWWQAEK